MRSVADALNEWYPDDATPAEVETVRAIVVAAGVHDGRVYEVPQVLRYCWEYLQYRRHHDLPTEPSVAFAADEVDAYRKTLTGPRGSISARCSYLRRLHPDVGLDGTTRPAAARDTDSDADSGKDDSQSTRAATPAVSGAARYRPLLLDDELWFPVAELTWGCVDAVAPQRRARTQILVTQLGYLAAWVNAQHRPLTVDVVLAGRTIEEFLPVVLAGGRATRWRRNVGREPPRHP